MGKRAFIIDKPGVLDRYELRSAPGMSDRVTGFVAASAGDDGNDACVDVWDVGPDTITSDEEDGLVRPKRGHR